MAKSFLYPSGCMMVAGFVGRLWVTRDVSVEYYLPVVDIQLTPVLTWLGMFGFLGVSLIYSYHSWTQNAEAHDQWLASLEWVRTRWPETRAAIVGKRSQLWTVRLISTALVILSAYEVIVVTGELLGLGG